MLISNLIVRKLYGRYDYDVTFNPDVTLIYGTNGCGKTTILNIITSIITGAIYKLFSYKFDRIILFYYDEKSGQQQKSILLRQISEKDSIELHFDQRVIIINELPILKERHGRKTRYDDVYFEEYPILEEIKKEFNYVYLALNRAAVLPDLNDSYYMMRERFFLKDGIIEPENVDPEIRYIEKLILTNYLNVSSKTNYINNKFRDKILKSALDVNSKTDIEYILKNGDWNKPGTKEIKRIRNSYIKILEDLQLISGEEKERYGNFFENYLTKLQRVGDQFEAKDLFDLIILYGEMKKIEKIVEIAEETEKQKAHVMQPIELFLDTVNEFIATSDFEKQVEINGSGEVYLHTEDNSKRMSIQYLSSGERQILVFFANLIFGVKDSSSGIFVVDEPELSLHLSWQRVFVRKALAVNKHVQFIFATHAPEIIGPYRDKAVKLERVRG